ncbi:MAG: hypothetical protein KGL39_16570 [Patescibacteria group bacterium]|nr:hypothetical protein [Patescibacteria group bacterium]
MPVDQVKSGSRKYTDGEIRRAMLIVYQLGWTKASRVTGITLDALRRRVTKLIKDGKAGRLPDGRPITRAMLFQSTKEAKDAERRLMGRTPQEHTLDILDNEREILDRSEFSGTIRDAALASDLRGVAERALLATHELIGRVAAGDISKDTSAMLRSIATVWHFAIGDAKILDKYVLEAQIKTIDAAPVDGSWIEAVTSLEEG